MVLSLIFVSGPIFDGKNHAVDRRLNPSDATFVEAIISASKEAGWDMDKSNGVNGLPGDRNIFLNGGNNHPLCAGPLNVKCRHSAPIRLLEFLTANNGHSCRVEIGFFDQTTNAQLKVATTFPKMASLLRLGTCAQLDQSQSPIQIQIGSWDSTELMRFPFVVQPATVTRNVNIFWLDATENSTTCPVPRNAIKTV